MLFFIHPGHYNFGLSGKSFPTTCYIIPWITIEAVLIEWALLCLPLNLCEHVRVVHMSEMVRLKVCFCGPLRVLGNGDGPEFIEL